MFTIGIDPHKGSHLAAVLDDDEQLLGLLHDWVTGQDVTSPCSSPLCVRVRSAS